MKMIIKVFLCLLLMLHINFSYIDTTCAAATNTNAEGQITEHAPNTRISNLKDMPKGKSGAWLWALLGVLVVAVGAAALASGSDSGGGGSDEGGVDTGSVGGSW
jgi:hypothetical protein